MQVRLLGPTWAGHGGETLALGGPRRRALFVMLACAPGRTATAEELIDGIWGERPPPRVRASIQVFASGIRRGFEQAGLDRRLLTHQAGAYSLHLDRDAVDVDRFEAAWRSGREVLDTDPESARQVLASALQEWTGPALADLREFPFSIPLVTRWEEMRVSAQEDLIDARIAVGDHRAVIGELEQLLSDHPTRERLWGQLMLALYRANRQADALATYTRARERLADELGIDPGIALQQLELSILRHDPALGAPEELLGATPSYPAALGGMTRALLLPTPARPLVGREDVLPLLLEHLTPAAGTQLVTLTGPGGIGKTRLALAAGEAVADTGPLVAFLSAVPGQSAEHFLGDLAVGLGAPEPADGLEPALAAITGALPSGPALVILDRVESLSGDLGQALDRLLAQLPDLTVLCTSRRPLRATHETEFAVPPLRVPASGTDVAGLAEVPASALFLQEARRASARFKATSDNAHDIGGLCRLLDGLPLALELAAARMKVLTPAQALARLNTDLDDLADPAANGRTLAAIIQWTLDILSPAALRLLQAMSLLEAGMTLADIEAAAGQLDPGSDPVTLLHELVDVGVVRLSDAQTDIQYLVLGPVGTHVARQAFIGAAEADAVRLTYLRALVARIGAWGEALDSAVNDEALARFNTAENGVVAMSQWAAENGHPDLVAETLLASAGLFIATGRTRTALGLARALPADAAQAPPALLATARLNYSAGNYAVAAEQARACLEHYRATSPERALALAFTAAAATALGDLDDGTKYAEWAIAAATETTQYVAQVVSWSVLAICAARRGDWDRERECYEQRLMIVRARGDRSRLADTLGILAEIALDTPDLDAAHSFCVEALSLAGTARPNERRDALITMSRVHILRREFAEAGDTLAQATELAALIGQPLAIAQCARVAACLVFETRPGSGRPTYRLFAHARQLERTSTDEDGLPFEADLRGVAERAVAEIGVQQAASLDASAAAVADASTTLSLIQAALDAPAEGRPAG